MPWFWIVAGPNGAGKTTLVMAGVVRQIAGIEPTSLNADVRTAAILAYEPNAPDANLRAAIETDARVASCIEERIDFLVEPFCRLTNISTTSTARLLSGSTSALFT